MGNVTPKYSVAGTVYRAGSKERVEGALVKAYAPDLPPIRTAVTNDDGDFSFDALESGSWTFTAMHEGSGSVSHGPISITEDKVGLGLSLPRLATTEDMAEGKALFTKLLVGLLLLALAYVGLHFFFPSSGSRISPAVRSLLVAAQEEAQSATVVSQSVALTSTVSTLQTTLSTNFTDTVVLGSEEREVLRAAQALVIQVQGSIEANNKDATLSQLRNLQRLLEQPLPGGFFWVEEPWRFVEVILWALAGVLSQLILTVGSYLRWGRYYREGASLHWAQLVTVPLVVLVVVLFLSLVTMRFTLAGSTEVPLDLREPRLLAAISFLIGIGPWWVWGFLRETSSRLLGRGGNSDSNDGK